MKKKIAIITVILIISVIIIKNLTLIEFLMLATQDNRMSKEKITKYVTQNQETIETAISDFINKNPDTDGNITELIGIPECKGIKGVYFYPRKEFYPIDATRIQFECGGYGMGSETGYAGFYYSLSEPKVELNNLENEADMSFLGYYSMSYASIGGNGGNNKFKPYDKGWRWREAGGDNTVYIEHIVGDFYYYLEEY